MNKVETTQEKPSIEIQAATKTSNPLNTISAKDLVAHMKETAEKESSVIFKLAEPKVEIPLKKKDAVSLDIIMYLADKYPDITPDEMTEQLQNATWWLSTLGLIGRNLYGKPIEKEPNLLKVVLDKANRWIKRK